MFTKDLILWIVYTLGYLVKGLSNYSNSAKLSYDINFLQIFVFKVVGP